MAERKQLLRRFKGIYLVFILIFIVVIGKIIYIQSVEYEGWMSVAKRYDMSEREIRPTRGNVFASDGKLIASTIPYYMVYMDTKVEPLHEKNGALFINNVDSISLMLSRVFGEYSPGENRQRFYKAYANGDRNFKLIKRRISYIELQKLKQMPLFREGTFKPGLDPNEIVNFRNGLKLRQYENRENLFGDLASRTVGNVYGAGMGGQYGLELGYDSLLRGKPGREQRTRAGSNWVYVTIEKPVEGMDIMTTLDMRLQDIADKALRDKLVELDASMGCLVLMEVQTGDIKACVNLSRVAPGQYKEQYNMAVADMSEPGSTFKTMSLLVALEDGVFSPTDSVDTYNGSYSFSGVEMTDHNKSHGGYGKISIGDALAFSSNIGVSRVIDEYYKDKPDKFVDGIYRTKITEPMDLGIKGAGKPMIRHPKDNPKHWYRTTLPWMSIGYEVKMPPIYTLTFYNAIANNGKMVQPRFVKGISDQGIEVEKFKTEVINSNIASASTIRTMRQLLENVVNYGTGKAVKSDVVSIAGKTGTAQLGYGNKGVATTHQVSFCGYFPADNPKYSAIVVIREPRNGYASGATMSGKVFKVMAERVYAQVNQVDISDYPRKEDAGFPRVASGNRQALRSALAYLNIDNVLEKSDWVQTKIEDNEVKGTVLPMADNYVPNVVGMGAQDAVYLIERSGMYVQLYGKGRVVRQSVQSGTRVVKGGTVVLTLK